MIRVARYLWGRLAEQVLVRPSLAVIFAAIIALSLASGVRTFQGILNFTGGQNAVLSGLLAVLITFGVQILMLVLAWRIGDVCATSGRVGTAASASSPKNMAAGGVIGRLLRAIGRSFLFRNFPLFASFLICASICVFFSFDAFYQGISTPEQRALAAKDQARRILLNIGVDIGRDLDKQYDDVAAQLTSGPDWQIYTNHLKEVMTTATDPGFVQAQVAGAQQQYAKDKEQFDSINKRIEAQKANRNDLGVTRDNIAGNVGDLERDVHSLDEKLKKLESDLNKAQDAVARKKAEVDAATVKRDNEATSGNGERKANGTGLNVGKGPKYREYSEELSSRQRELQSLQNQVKQLDDQIKTIRDERNEKQKQLQADKIKLATASAQLESAQVEVMPSDLAKRVSTGGATGAIRADAEASKLGAMLATFNHERTPKNWAGIEQQCVGIVDLVRKSPGYADKANALNCSPPFGTRKLAGNLLALEQRRTEFAQACSSADTAKSDFVTIVDLGTRCLQIAQLSNGHVANFESSLNTLREELDQGAHTFNKSMAGFKYGDHLAYLAAMMALGLDGLIFIAGMWGARSSVSNLTRRGNATAGEIDHHAKMAMAMETRSESVRPAVGWPEPAEVYKARAFLRRLRRYSNPDTPELTGSISCGEVQGMEGDAIRSVLLVGPFAAPRPGTSADSETWLVTDRLIRYVTGIVGNYDRLQQLDSRPDRKAGVPAYQPDTPRRSENDTSTSSFWGGAARAANGHGRTAGEDSAKSEDDFLDAGHMTYATGPVRSESDAITEDDSTPGETEGAEPLATTSGSSRSALN